MVKSTTRKRTLSESHTESERDEEEKQEVFEEKNDPETTNFLLTKTPHPSSSSIGDEASKESLKISLKLPTSMKRRESSTDERHILKICLKKPVEKKDDESVSSSMNGSDEESVSENGTGLVKTPSRHPRPKDLYQAMTDCLHVFTK
jgi:hypothetical protein